MTVSSLGAVAAGIERAQPTRNTQINNAVSALLREPVDSVNVSSSPVRQGDVVGLRNASVNVAQTQATVQVAQNGATEIGALINRAAALANTAANPNVSDVQRVELNTTFQAVRAGINNIASSASFNGING